MSSFMAAAYEDLSEEIRIEVKAFVGMNVIWLTKVLIDAGLSDPESYERRARAIYTAVAGAQSIARTRCNIGLFDELILTYQETGLIPMQHPMQQIQAFN